ncbi:MAG: hypothetical protein GY866_27855, partial [Proteobacteria bacterium]|nr:hypothetical protein [Pseudomonadota bacterium]
MEICYTDTLDRIEDAVNMRQSILVECDKQLTIPIYQALRARKKREGKDKVFIDPGNPSVGGDAGNSNEGRGVLSIVSRLESLLMDSDVSDKVIILHHLDLMALGSDSLLDQMARNMTYLLHLNPLAVFVAFKDPEIPLPESLVRFFSMSTSIFGIERRHLYKIITAEEAKRFGETRIDIYDLYKRFSGLNALQIRQLLERIVGMKIPHFPMGEEEVRRELRRRTLSASYMELPDITFDDIGGCGEIIEKLEQDILRFVDMLK